MFRITLTICSAFLTLSIAINTAIASPCVWGHMPTLREQYRNADSSVIVSWVSGKPADVEAGFGGNTEWKIVRVLHDSPKESVAMNPGDSLKLDEYCDGRPGKQFLMLGHAIENGDFELTFSRVPLEYSETLLSYIIQSPPSDAIASVQLGYFVQHLESSDANVAEDAHQEFGGHSLDDIIAFQSKLPLDQIRQWLANPQTAPSHLGLYGLLIGQFGTKADIPLLKNHVLVSGTGYRHRIEGLFIGYLLLSGETGLAELEKAKLQTQGVKFSEVYSTMEAIRFMWTDGNDRISKDRLKQAMRILLDRPELADLVIIELLKWQDWSVSDRLMELYGTTDIPSTKRAIVRFYLTAEATKPTDPKEPLPPHAVTAQKHLKTLRETDPETVKAAEEFFYLNF